jgi:hypothetical protein
MRFILQLVLIGGLSYISEMFFPWWTIVICAFFIGLFVSTSGLNAFLSGFLGLGLLWMVYAWIIDLQTDSILSTKIAALFTLTQPAILIVLTGFIAAVVGGLGSLTGNFLRRIFVKEKPQSKYFQ